MKILNSKRKMKLFSVSYRLHHAAEKQIENAQGYREKAKWAFLSGLGRAGVYWLS